MSLIFSPEENYPKAKKNKKNSLSYAIVREHLQPADFINKIEFITVIKKVLKHIYTWWIESENSRLNNNLFTNGNFST